MLTPSLLSSYSTFNSQKKHLDFLAKLVAGPLLNQPKKPTLNLSLAIDRSGSMSSGNALEHAKQATLNLLSRLAPSDRIAVVMYDGTAEVALPSCLVSEARLKLPMILNHYHPRGSTALHKGWLTAAGLAAPFVGEYDISRVLLLSDGQATDGQKDPSALKEEAHQLLAAGISTASYGLGLGFNELLMTEIAAGGPARFAQDALQLEPYFDADFDLLSQTIAPHVSVRITAKSKEQILPIENLNDFNKDEKGFYRLPAAVADAKTWAAFRCSLDLFKDLKSIDLQAEWKWVTLDGVEHSDNNTITVKFGKKLSNANEEVLESCAELDAARLARKASEAARLGDFVLAGQQVQLMRGLSANNAYICGVAAHLDGLVTQGDAASFSKEALYSSTTMSNRIADNNEVSASMQNDRFGLRKSVQGKAQTGDRK